MKPISFILFVSLASFSFAQNKNEGDRFLGIWNPAIVTANNYISDCVIRRRGSEYTLQYADAKGIHALFFKMKNGVLVGGDKSYGNVVFLPTSGHIKWKEGEFEKAARMQVSGVPLSK